MTTLTTEELLKRATPLKDWKFEKCPCGSPVCNKFLLNIARSSRMFDPEHAELIRRMAASWEAMREALTEAVKTDHHWHGLECAAKDGESECNCWVALAHKSLALSNGEEPEQ